MKNLGKVLHCFRVCHDLGCREFAKQLRMSPATLIRIEAGRAPSAEHLRNILAWLMEEP